MDVIDRAWQHAMQLMLEAAEGGEVEAVTKQLGAADRRGVIDGTRLSAPIASPAGGASSQTAPR